MAAKKVAIVGSGPTGRAAARELAGRGAQVTVFEKESEPGGLMRWGYPEFRMPLAVTRRDVAALQELGVRFEVNAELGKTVQLADLERDHDAVLITAGASRPRRLGIPGEDLPGVHKALDFLYAARAGRPVPAGPDVLVIGGGDTAVDAAVTSARNGAERVTILYRGTEDAAPAQPHEFKRSHESGVNWRFETRPVRIDPLSGSLAVTLHGAGRSNIEPEEFHAIVTAIGQETDPAFLKMLDLTANPDGSTSRPNVWLAGGSRYGSDRLAKAIQDGRTAAQRIART